MEWHFCYADWNCWANWFWSSSTAAWVQAILTVIAMTVSLVVSLASIFNAQKLHDRQIKENRDKAIHDEVLQYHKNIVRAKVVMSRLGGGADNIVNLIGNGVGNDPRLFRLALSERLETVKDDLAELRKIMMAELPNPGVIVLVNNGVIIGEDFKASLAHSLSEKPPKIDLFSAKDASNRMKSLHDHLHDYHVNHFMSDPKAVPEKFRDVSGVKVDHAAP